MLEHGGCLEICSTRCDHGMWSLEMPFLEDVPCMGMVRKLFNILNGCVKVYTQMISLLFFCQLVAMQVRWMKACAIFNDHRLYHFCKIGTLHLHGRPF
jgi:hypothetical protein